MISLADSPKSNGVWQYRFFHGSGFPSGFNKEETSQSRSLPMFELLCLRPLLQPIEHLWHSGRNRVGGAEFDIVTLLHLQDVKVLLVGGGIRNVR